MHIEVVATLKLGISLLVTTVMYTICKALIGFQLNLVPNGALQLLSLHVGKTLHYFTSIKFLCLSSIDTIYLFTDVIGHTPKKNKFWDKCILPGAREITRFTFYVSLTSQDQEGPILQVLLNFLASKSFLLFLSFRDFRLSLCFVIAIFLLQCNLISNYFRLTSSGGCPNYTFRRLIPQGIHDQGGQAHLAKMHLR